MTSSLSPPTMTLSPTTPTTGAPQTQDFPPLKVSNCWRGLSSLKRREGSLAMRTGFVYMLDEAETQKAVPTFIIPKGEFSLSYISFWCKTKMNSIVTLKILISFTKVFGIACISSLTVRVK